MKTQHVLEYSQPTIRGNTIERVKIIGLESANGRRYPAAVLQAAVPLYESAPVFICHPDPREKRRGSRMLRDHLGNLENVSGNGNGLFGDLRIKGHPLAKQILEAAPSASFGLSHNAHVEVNEDETEVTRIVEVNSVDLVDDPATTKNLFEETGEVDADFEAKVLAVLAKSQQTKPTKRLTALEDRAGGDFADHGIGNTHEDFLTVVRGFPLT